MRRAAGARQKGNLARIAKAKNILAGQNKQVLDIRK
jgi:hypothetical protein